MIAKNHSLVGEYARFNLSEAIEPSREEEVNRLRTHATNTKAEKLKTSSLQGLSSKRLAQRDHAMPYSEVLPASILVHLLDTAMPSILVYVRGDPNELVFSQSELIQAAGIAQSADELAPFGHSFRWQSWNAPHNSLGNTLQMLQSSIGSAVIHPLSEAADEFLELHKGGQKLHEGLLLCANVIAELCKLLSSAGNIEFVPLPQGSRRTPTTQHLEEPPKEIAKQVTALRQLIAEEPKAKHWNTTKLLDKKKSKITGNRQLNLRAIKFLQSQQELDKQAE